LSGPDPKLELRSAGDGVLLKVRLTPRSARDEVVGLEMFGSEAVLKARVRAVPEDGRANQALERLIAHWLKVPPSAVSVAQGGKSRLKQVLVAGEPAILLRLIEGRVAELLG
jgi:uncharacterized protein (TIGR00251 family)